MPVLWGRNANVAATGGGPFAEALSLAAQVACWYGILGGTSVVRQLKDALLGPAHPGVAGISSGGAQSWEGFTARRERSHGISCGDLESERGYVGQLHQNFDFRGFASGVEGHLRRLNHETTALTYGPGQVESQSSVVNSVNDTQLMWAVGGDDMQKVVQQDLVGDGQALQEFFVPGNMNFMSIIGSWRDPISTGALASADAVNFIGFATRDSGNVITQHCFSDTALLGSPNSTLRAHVAEDTFATALGTGNLTDPPEAVLEIVSWDGAGATIRVTSGSLVLDRDVRVFGWNSRVPVALSVFKEIQDNFPITQDLTLGFTPAMMVGYFCYSEQPGIDPAQASASGHGMGIWGPSSQASEAFGYRTGSEVYDSESRKSARFLHSPRRGSGTDFFYGEVRELKQDGVIIDWSTTTVTQGRGPEALLVIFGNKGTVTNARVTAGHALSKIESTTLTRIPITSPMLGGYAPRVVLTSNFGYPGSPLTGAQSGQPRDQWGVGVMLDTGQAASQAHFCQTDGPGTTNSRSRRDAGAAFQSISTTAVNDLIATPSTASLVGAAPVVSPNSAFVDAVRDSGRVNSQKWVSSLMLGGPQIEVGYFEFTKFAETEIRDLPHGLTATPDFFLFTGSRMANNESAGAGLHSCTSMGFAFNDSGTWRNYGVLASAGDDQARNDVFHVITRETCANIADGISRVDEQRIRVNSADATNVQLENISLNGPSNQRTPTFSVVPMLLGVPLHAHEVTTFPANGSITASVPLDFTPVGFIVLSCDVGGGSTGWDNTTILVGWSAMGVGLADAAGSQSSGCFNANCDAGTGVGNSSMRRDHVVDLDHGTAQGRTSVALRITETGYDLDITIEAPAANANHVILAIGERPAA